jgi:hypothetical protein
VDATSCALAALIGAAADRSTAEARGNDQVEARHGAGVATPRTA